MGVLTNLLKLLKPGENDYYNQQTEQADNWQKVDDYAVLTNTDKNGIWGGEYGGGLIEDPSVTKVVGKRYIGADGKAYICLVPSNVNNTTNYAPCNVVDNLKTLNELDKIISKSIFIPPNTPAYEVKFDFIAIPKGFEIVGYCCTARISTTDIEENIYKTLDTPISYSVKQDGTLKVSCLVDVGVHARVADFLVKVSLKK